LHTVAERVNEPRIAFRHPMVMMNGAQHVPAPDNQRFDMDQGMHNTRRLAIGCVLLATAAAPLCTHASEYRFDTVHTQIFFCASHMRFSRPCGRMHVKSGYFVFDNDHWSKSRVDVVIDLDSLDMGDRRWNETLRSWQFLDTGDHPTAHFVSTRVEKTGDRQGIIHGKLSLHGVTRPLDLKVTFNRAAVDPYTFHFTAGFSASAMLKRSEFGMKKYLPDIVGNEVSINVQVEGLRGGKARRKTPGKED